MTQNLENKPVIAVDIDEVLFPLAPTFLKYYNQQTNTSYGVEDMTSYYMEEVSGEPREVVLEKLKAYLDSEYHTGAKPISGAIEAISRLRKNYSLVIVTARAPFFEGHTQKFLHEHFSGLYDGFYNIHQSDIEHKHLSKAQACKEIGAVALIDDHLNYVLDAAQNGVSCLLFGNYAWNQTDKLPDKVTRVKNWREVLEYFDGRS
jgi:uncharacterized HAD superfamily protein